MVLPALYPMPALLASKSQPAQAPLWPLPAHLLSLLRNQTGNKQAPTAPSTLAGYIHTSLEQGAAAHSRSAPPWHVQPTWMSNRVRPPAGQLQCPVCQYFHVPLRPKKRPYSSNRAIPRYSHCKPAGIHLLDLITMLPGLAHVALCSPASVNQGLCVMMFTLGFTIYTIVSTMNWP